MLSMLMSMAVCSTALISCGDEDEPLPTEQSNEQEGGLEGDQPGNGSEQNTTDVAVTGQVSEVGAFYAKIKGVVNLEVLSSSYTDEEVEIGVEVSVTEEFPSNHYQHCYRATEVIDRTFSVRVGLFPEQKYYYRTYVRVIPLSNVYYFGETYSFTTKKPEFNNANHYVDLGLPSGTLWATMNVGASKPEDYGDYYNWGETTTKDIYDASSYQHCNGSIYALTKYCNDSHYGYNGFTDNLTELLPEDDAAYMNPNWGSQWRMPSVEQLKELIYKCGWWWYTLNGVNGYAVYSRTNSNAIFLPAAGAAVGSFSGASNGGSSGYYLSRTLHSQACYGTKVLLFNPDIIDMGTGGRDCGHSVRPVRVSQ